MEPARQNKSVPFRPAVAPALMPDNQSIGLAVKHTLSWRCIGTVLSMLRVVLSSGLETGDPTAQEEKSCTLSPVSSVAATRSYCALLHPKKKPKKTTHRRKEMVCCTHIHTHRDGQRAVAETLQRTIHISTHTLTSKSRTSLPWHSHQNPPVTLQPYQEHSR